MARRYRKKFEYLASFGATIPVIQWLIKRELNELVSYEHADVNIMLPDITFLSTGAGNLSDARSMAAERFKKYSNTALCAFAFPTNTSTAKHKLKDLVDLERQRLVTFGITSAEEQQRYSALTCGEYPYYDPRMKWFITGYYEVTI